MKNNQTMNVQVHDALYLAVKGTVGQAAYWYQPEVGAVPDIILTDDIKADPVRIAAGYNFYTCLF